MSIEISNVSKTYVTMGKRHTVFKNFNLTIERGVNWGVIGPNGAGKTTLLRMIAGALPPDTGHIKRNMSVSWPLGYGGSLNTSLTGRMNARFLARLYGKNPTEVERAAAEWSEIGKFMDWPVKTYSSGMRSRLAFALSIAIDFDCVLIDEGASAGDARFRAKSQEALEERRKRSSLLLVTHNLKEVTRLCDRLVVLGGPRPEITDDVERRVKRYAVELSGDARGMDL
ncbi:MAG: ABC transporter ATP-binding protein [Caulobacteraceae bacterium]